jgi:hypothetical protein
LNDDSIYHEVKKIIDKWISKFSALEK